MGQNNNKLSITIILLSALLVSACKSGSQDSNDAPVAVASANHSVTRAGSEIVLSSRDSDDPDGVVFEHDWQLVDIVPPLPSSVRIAGAPRPAATRSEQIDTFQANNLIADDNLTAVKFRVPGQIQEDTTFVFELTVRDDDNKVGKDRISILARAIPDPDRFLVFFDVPDNFTVVAGTNDPDGSGIALTADVDFTLTLETRFDYPGINLGGTPQPQPTVVRNRQVTGTWLAADQTGGRNCDALNNPRIRFDIPKVDLDDLPNAEDSLSDQVDVNLTVRLDALSVVDTYLCILDADGNVIKEGKGAQTGFDSELSLTLDELQQQDPLQENKQTAIAYYAAIDPGDEKTTLNDWLNAVDFQQGDGIVETAYINGFDLGFGRHMFVNTRKATGEVYTYVLNHPNLDSIQDVSFGINTLGTVVMEFSPPPGESATTDLAGYCTNCYTKFFTYVPDPATGDQRRVLGFDFDGRGEKFQPGTCAACHGGQPTELAAPKGPGDIGARFLPWDVSTLFFSDRDYETDPAQRTLGPSPAQQEAFRKYNESVLITIPKASGDPTDPANIDVRRTLIHGWYGSTDFNSDTLPANDFRADFVPDTWKPEANGGPAGNPDDADALYLKVIGPTCRACHAQRDEPEWTGEALFTAETYANFATFKAEVAADVFDEATMPMGRLTLDNFWVDNADRSTLLAAHMENELGVALAGRAPGTPLAKINGLDGSTPIEIAAGRDEAVRLEGDASLFAETFAWALVSAPAASAAQLVGANPTGQLYSTGLTTDTHGDWVVRLTVANDKGDEDTVDATISVVNNLPDAVDDPAATSSDTQVNIPVLTNDALGDAPTVLAVEAASVSAGATATVAANGTSIDYTPASGAFGDDSFDYSITDVDGDADTATVTVTISEFTAVDDTGLSVLADNPLNNIDVTTNDKLGTPPTTLTLPSATSANGGTVSINPDDTLNYQPQQFYTSPTPDTFDYTITDSTSASRTATVSVTVTPQAPYAAGVHGIWADQGCGGCHSELDGAAASQTYDYANTWGGTPDSGTGLPVLLCKPLGTGGCSHSGGSFFADTNDAQYQTILRWINEGRQNN